MTDHRRLLRPAIWAFYLVIVLEFLFMISPLALYFYSSYGPALNLLHLSPATSWLTGFFLPHFSITDGPLDSLKPIGFQIALAGLALFVFAAVQVYGAKLLRRGAVTGGLYRWVRHPQYTGLALLGLGVTLVWPRFLVLVSLVIMLFLYRLLARWEEDLCRRKFGDGYARYQERTGMFLPRLRPHPPAAALEPGARRVVRTAAVWAAGLLAALALGLGLRELSLSRISALYLESAAVLSPAPLRPEELQGAWELARGHPAVAARLEEGDGPGWAVYVVPESWYLADLPLHSWHELPAEKRRGHVTPADFDRDLYKVLFTRVRTHRPESRGRQILRAAWGREPVLRAHLDLARGEVTAVESPPATVVWGDIPTPMF